MKVGQVNATQTKKFLYHMPVQYSLLREYIYRRAFWNLRLCDYYIGCRVVMKCTQTRMWYAPQYDVSVHVPVCTCITGDW